MNAVQVNGFTRISKVAAKHLWGTGERTIHLCPKNLRPGAPWYPEASFSPLKQKEITFESAVNQFEYYNCVDSETGKYAAYYLGVEPINPIAAVLTTGVKQGKKGL